MDSTTTPNMTMYKCYKQDMYEYIIEVLETEPLSIIQQESILMCQNEIAKIQRASIGKSVANKKYYEKKKAENAALEKK